MDNQAAMFTAQQMQYNKMYGMDPGRRMDELAAAQSQLRPGYGQHPWVKLSVFFSIYFLLVIFSLFSVILFGPGRHIHLPPQLQFGTVLRFYCSQRSRTRRGRVKIRAEIAQFSLFSPLHFPPSDQQQTGLMSNILGYCEPPSRSYLSSIINGIISTEKKIISPLRRG